jgi:hypothetical protein
LFAELAHSVGEDSGALRGFAFPEGQAGWRAVGVFDQDATYRFDTLDAPTSVAEKDDVTGGGVDGEVLVEGGYLYPFWLQYDVVEGDVGDGSAVGDGDAAGAAAWVEMALDGVVEKVSSVAAAAGFDAVGEEGDEVVEAFASEVAIGVGAAKDVVECLGGPGFRSAAGDYLLHEDVDGFFGNL